MPTRDRYDAGIPSWVDLMSPDVDASTDFYTSLFGWDAEDQHDDEGNRIYTMFRQDGHDIAGLGGQMPGTEGMPPVWNTYVATDDCDATVKKAEAAGGSVIAPTMQVMDSGRMAIVADPAGAVVSLWQADQHEGAGLVNEPNALSWNELMTRDRDGVLDFYAQTFGWSFEDVPMDGGWTYRVAKLDDEHTAEESIAGMMDMPAEMSPEVPNHWSVYFAVADAEAICQKATELGGQVVFGPEDSPVGKLASIIDPQGGSFSIMQHPEDAS